jgi:hypothetical protein
MKIKAAVLREYNKPVSIEDIDLAPPKEREVLVKTAEKKRSFIAISLILPTPTSKRGHK